MSDTATKICIGPCHRELPRTAEYFVADKSAKDGLRNDCKKCYGESRKSRKNKSPEFKALNRLARLVKDAHAVMEDPTATFAERFKADQTIRNADKRRQKLMEPIEAAHKEAETAARLADTNPSLARVHALGSALFGADGSLLDVSERAAQLEKFKAALLTLTGVADAAARDYVTSNIKRLNEMVGDDAKREAETGKYEQDTLNGHAIQRAIGEIHDEFLPKIRAAKSDNAKHALRKQLWALKRSAEAVTTSTDKDDTGAQNSVVAKALAKEYDKLARLLYGKNDTPRNQIDTLENIQSRIDQANAAQEWMEQAEQARQKYWNDLRERNPKQFERESRSLELQVKGDGPLADLQRKTLRDLRRSNPLEYERRALEALKPRKVTQDVLVYVVTTPQGVQWLWPDGREVRHGGDVEHAEIIKDARLGWCLAPEPASAELENTSSVKQELIQEDDGSWHWIPEGSRGTWSQQTDGTWKQARGAGISPWAKATPIVFKNGEPHLEGSGRDYFAHGSWWTLAEIQKADASYSENPLMVLPPLQRVVADSIATEPQRPNPKDGVEPNKWKRHEQKQREEKEAEQGMLRGVYKWNTAVKTA